MNIANTLTRALNQPIKNRIYQGINGLIVQVTGRPLKISHLLEYPKCGGSWVRNMMQTYVGSEPYLVDRIVGPKTVIHLHRNYNNRFSYPVVLFRDPRDVFVSFYFYERSLAGESRNLKIDKHFRFNDKANTKQEFTKYLKMKLTQPTNPYFKYKEFIKSWWGRKDVCYVFYENFKKTPESELTKILRFIGEDIKQEKLLHAIEYNSFEKVTMRKYGKLRKPGEEDNVKFQRKGISGDWVNYFNNHSCEILVEHMGDDLITLGYEESNDWAYKIERE